MIGDAAQITGVDKDDKDVAIGESIEEAIEDTHVENIGLENDSCNNPTESPIIQDYMTENVPTMTDNVPTYEHIESPTTPTKTKTPSKPQ